jgi:hypothetical protein
LHGTGCRAAPPGKRPSAAQNRVPGGCSFSPFGYSYPVAALARE